MQANMTIGQALRMREECGRMTTGTQDEQEAAALLKQAISAMCNLSLNAELGSALYRNADNLQDIFNQMLHEIEPEYFER